MLLNNDVVVTDGWLEQLIALVSIRETTEGHEGGSRENGSGEQTTEHTEATEVGAEDASRMSNSGERKSFSGDVQTKIALVGPMSNYAAPPQLVEDVPYRDLDEMKVFASQWRDEHRGKWFSVPKISGFCLLMKRSVYDAIGGLDERFGLGFFDDDDLAERARRAGFELAVVQDLFVHHFGSRTFVGNGVDAAKLLDENASGLR